MMVIIYINQDVYFNVRSHLNTWTHLLESADQPVQTTLLLKAIFVYRNVIYSYNIHNAFRNAMKGSMKMEIFVLNAKVNAKPAIPI